MGFQANATTGASGRQLYMGMDLGSLTPQAIGEAQERKWGKRVRAGKFIKLTDIANSNTLPPGITMIARKLIDNGAHWAESARIVNFEDRRHTELWFQGRKYMATGSKIYSEAHKDARD